MKLWLGGVELGAIAPGTVFNAIGGKGKVMLRSARRFGFSNGVRSSASLSRDGLVGVATVEEVIQPGVLLRKVE